MGERNKMHTSNIKIDDDLYTKGGREKKSQQQQTKVKTHLIQPQFVGSFVRLYGIQEIENQYLIGEQLQFPQEESAYLPFLDKLTCWWQF